jgi:tRNA-dihydrouridine synthase 1
MTPETSPKLLAYTPMLHGRMFTETAKFRNNHFQPIRSGLADKPNQNPSTYPKSDIYLDGNPSIDRPLFAQFCANDADELLESAKYVAPFCDAVDLNLGCPQGIAKRGKYGAFLQEDQELIYRLINNLHKNLSVPVTAKIRVLETREKTLEYAKNVLSAGASILTVHGRLREQKGHNTGLADWDHIRFLRENLPKETVLFANGNILRREDIDACLEATGADGVMSAEGNLYDPGIFADAPPIGQEGRDYWRGKDGLGGWRMDAAYRRYMDILYKYVLEVPLPARKPLYLPSDPVDEFEQEEEVTEEEDQPPKKKRKGDKEKVTNPNLCAMQPHLFHLLRALVNKHHDVRDALARCKPGDIVAYEKVLQMVEKKVKEGIKAYAETDGKSIEEDFKSDDRYMAEVPEKTADTDAVVMSSVTAVKACKRPWWVCQPHIRPLPNEALQKGSLTLSKKEKAKLDSEGKRADGEVKTDAQPHVEVEQGVEVPKEGLVCG